MNKSKRRKELAERKLAKKRAMRTPGYESRYARKRKYLDRNGGWGFEYAEPKPWKSAA